ncbi:MAG: type II toxin-antitoxin system RelE/ParE family toxin [Gallionellaceae bacterium]|nr:type II toxin-antitoxin system RelE/ParE family toxin [Gallionellaceae bacterium]
MSNKKIANVKFTANFEANLAEIDAFLTQKNFSQGYLRLLDELSDAVIPNLERFPAMGRLFIERQPQSVEALTKQEALRARLAKHKGSAELREYVLDEYLVLYEKTESVVYMLSIKHHKQLTFDFEFLNLS